MPTEEDRVLQAVEHEAIDAQYRQVLRKLRTITDAIPARISYVDANQNIQFANESFASEFGVLRQGLIGKPVREVIGEENFLIAAPHLAAALGGQHVVFELKLENDEATTTYNEITYVPDFGDANEVNGCFVLAIDITERKLAALATADREAHLRSVIDHTLGFIGMLKVDGTLLEANHAALELGGTTRDAVVGKKFWNCPWWNFSARSSSQLKSWIKQAARGAIIRHDAEMQMAGGKRAMIEFMLVPVKDEKGRVTHLIPSGIDISERKKAEENLASSNQRLSLAMSAAGMGSFEWNFTTDEVYWDQQHQKLTGLSDPSEHVGESFFDLIHPDDVDMQRQRIRDAIENSGEFDGEFRITRVDGETRWLAARASVIAGNGDRDARLVGMNWDITAQKQALIRFKLGEERLRLAAEAAGFGTYQADLKKNESIWSDDLMIQVGVDVGKKIVAGSLDVPPFVHPEDRARVATELANAVKSEAPFTHAFTHRIIRPDGEVRWVKLKGKTICQKNGSPEQIIGTLLDITQQKKIEQSLEESRRVAEAASQSKSEFLANMSHEIRTPMSAIMGYTELLTRQLTDPDDLKCASIIRHNGNFLLEIINDILDISKIEAGKLEISKKRFQPQQVLYDVHSLMAVRASEKGIELETEVLGEIPKTIRSDAKRLKQILVNLIGNAIKFTDSGSVRVVVRHVDDAKPKLRFDVIDTGIGMTVAQEKQLFQPFTQADSSLVREYGGTGLGLSISQRLAKMLGGEITVQSTSQIGSTFTVTVDTGSLRNVSFVKAEPIREPSAKTIKLESLPNIEGRILVVDDRREIRFIAQQFIEDAGGVVVAAENGRDAIERVREAIERNQPFDLIAMDMQMPVMDGYQATAQLRSEGFENPIIAMTAHAMEGDRDKCLANGCTDYVAKPLHGPNFIKLLAQYLGKQHNLPTRTCRVLVIEDAEDAGRSLKQLLEFNGHKVAIARNGSTGLELAERFTPDVILLDLGLPDISGFRVLKQLRQKKALPNTIIVATTGRDDQEATQRAGFDGHLIKPISFDDLASMIDAHIKRIGLQGETVNCD